MQNGDAKNHQGEIENQGIKFNAWKMQEGKEREVCMAEYIMIV